jgi:4'-phosphopantetheinyl transferase
MRPSPTVSAASGGVSSGPAWLPGPEVLAVTAGVDVWRGSLTRDAAELQLLAGLLDPDERRRATRFVFPLHRGRYVAGRGLLRRILARYLGVLPGSLLFEYNAHGKPALRLSGIDDAPPLTFNLSHSDDELVVAVSRGRMVGIDIERVPDADDHTLDTAEIAERFFSPEERRALAELAPGERRRGFFACWTRKEAFIKALGGGLSVPLDAFDVTVGPEEPPRLLGHRLLQAAARSWSLHTLPTGPDVVATLAVGPGLVGERDSLRLWCC